jgi:hypothetical protein
MSCDDDASVIDSESQQSDNSLQQSPESSQATSLFLQAWQRRKIAELEGKLETLESGRAAKERYDRHFMHRVGFTQASVRQTNYYLAQGRGIRRVVALFDSIEDLVMENDRRYDDNEDAATIE